MSDRPDFTSNTALNAVADAIDNLPVSINAQQLGSLAVDIAAQSAGDIDINLNTASDTVTVALGSSTVTLDVNISGSNTTLDTNISGTNTTLDIDITSQSGGNIDTAIDDQTIDELVVNQARLGAEEITSKKVVRTQPVSSSGGRETVTLQPPTGTIQQVASVNFFTQPVVGSSSVTHELEANVTPADNPVLEYTSGADNFLVVAHTRAGTATQGSVPSGLRAKQEAVKLLQATNADPVNFEYINRAAQDQTNNREYTILLRELQV
jgi:hypothetical protein